MLIYTKIVYNRNNESDIDITDNEELLKTQLLCQRFRSIKQT